MIEGILVSLFGIACLWGARYWLRLRWRVGTWPIVPGRVTSRGAMQPADRGLLTIPAFRWAPDVRFSYRVAGADYVGDKIWLPWSWTSTRGKAEAFVATIPESVDVRYDPADPKTSCLWVPPYSNVLWCGIPGIVLLGIGLLWTLVKIAGNP